MFNFLPHFSPFESFVRYLSQFDLWKDFIKFTVEAANIKQGMIFQIARSTDDTLYVLFFSGLYGLILGLPIGVTLFITRKGQILESRWIHLLLSFIVNLFRAAPFVILIIWLIPFTKLIMGLLTGTSTFLGKDAVIIPLCIGIAPLIARMIENALLDIPQGLIEAARTMGATPFQIIRKVLIPESLPVIVNSVTIALIGLTGYVAMVGLVGTNVLGQVAMQYGYNSYNPYIMNSVLILMVLIVFIIQFIGDKTVKRILHARQ